eukprot:10421304-Ditylum_brightwellii.AAC.1
MAKSQSLKMNCRKRNNCTVAWRVQMPKVAHCMTWTNGRTNAVMAELDAENILNPLALRGKVAREKAYCGRYAYWEQVTNTSCAVESIELATGDEYAYGSVVAVGNGGMM